MAAGPKVLMPRMGSGHGWRHGTSSAAVSLVALVLLCGRAFGGTTDVHVGAEFTFDGEVDDIQWFGAGTVKDTLLLQSGKGRLYRSEDHGETWTDLTPIFSSDTGKDEEGVLRVGRLHRSHADPAVVMAFCSSGPVAGMISKDSGRSWDVVNKALRLQSWQFHPTRPTWALASHWSEGCRTDVPSALGHQCTHDLYLTKDLGRTFEQVATQIVQFHWGTQGTPGTAEFIDLKDRIYLTRFTEKFTGNQQRLTRWRQGIALVHTDDLGVSFEQLLENGNKFQATSGFILAVQCTDEKGQKITLMISNDNGRTFKEAQLPHQLKHRSYSVLDTSEGAIVLHVNHGGSTGDVYISDASGVSFTLSLSGNLRKLGICAFEKVMNLDGIYIANIVGDQALATALKTTAYSGEAQEVFEGETMGSQQDRMSIRWLSEEDEMEEEEEEVAEGEATLSRADAELRARGKVLNAVASSQKGAAGAAGSGRRLLKVNDDLRTVISFDKGGAWQSLTPPAKTLDGQVPCTGKKCNLHLHGFTEFFDFSPVYSYRNAVGLLMGSGNVGEKMTFDKSQTSTYLSRDAGITWIEVKKGTWIYEYGNHGGLVVMADMAAKTTKAEYSFDEGNSWTEIPIAEEPFDVENVLTEPDAVARKFVLYGHRGGTGVVRMLDFSKLHERNCSGADQPGADTSDYEKWSPSDSLNGDCILGHRTTYVRRKQLTQCHNEDYLEHPTFKRNCVCTKEDFECAFGFVRRVGSVDCVLDPSQHIAEPAECHLKHQFKTDSYRRVPGDSCVGGFEPKKETVSCHLATLRPAAKQLRPVATSSQEVARGSSAGSFFGTFAGFAGVLLGITGACYVTRSGMFVRMLNGANEARTMGKYARPGPAPPIPPVAGAEMVGTSAAGYRPPQ